MIMQERNQKQIEDEYISKKDHITRSLQWMAVASKACCNNRLRFFGSLRTVV